MNNTLITLFLFNVLFLFSLEKVEAQSFKISDYEKKITNSFKLKSVSEKVSKDDLVNELKKFIAETRPQRITGTPGHQKAQEYLIKELQALKNGKVEVQEFPLEKGVGKNIIWQKTTTSNKATPDEKHFVLITHFDAKKLANLKPEQEYQAADASASSVALMIVMARLFNELEMPKTVELVFLDAVENQKKGVWQYLDKYKNTNALYLDINSIAHDSKLKDKNKALYNMGFYYVDHANEKNKAVYDQFLAYGKNHYPQLKLENKALVTNLYFDVDDAFKSANLSLFVLSHDRENDINQRLGSTNDFIETLNLETYFFVYKFITSNILAFNYDISK